MLSGSNKYLYCFLQRKITNLVLLMFFSIAGYSQYQLQPKDTLLLKTFSPIFVAALKNPYKLIIPHAGTSFRVYMKKPSRTLMYWPNYPLTNAQIEARNNEWERRSKQSIGTQIASDIANDIIKNQVNSLIYGRKHAPAVTPKF